MRFIAEHGGVSGGGSYEGRGISSCNKLKLHELQQQGLDTVEANSN